MISEARLNIIKEKLQQRIPIYYHDFRGLEYIVEQVHFKKDSSSPLYLFKARDMSNNIHKSIVVKFAPVYDDNNEGATEYRNLSYLYKRFEASNEGVHVARPLDFFSDINALITEKVEGEQLSRRMLRLNSKPTSSTNKEELFELIRKCVRCLRMYHQFTRQEKRSSLSDEFANKLKGRMLYLEKFGFPNEVTKKIMSIVNEVSYMVDQHNLPWAGQHGDFGSQNIVVSQRDIYVFDLQRYHPEAIYNDLGYFLVTLETMNTFPKYPLYNFRYTKMFQKAFLTSYFNVENNGLKNVDRLLLAVYYLKNLIYRCGKQRYNIRIKNLKVLLPFFDLLKTSRYYPKRAMQLISEIEAIMRNDSINKEAFGNLIRP